MSSNKEDNHNENEDDEDEPIHPIFYYTTTFLLLTTLLQIITSYHNATGPIDWFSGLLIPQLATMAIMTANGNEDEVGIDGKICPPDDSWIDSAFDQKLMNNNNNDNRLLYSSENDPRLKLTRPSLFPHCSLNRWVHWEERQGRSCPSGQEYVTVIHPPRRRVKQSTDGNSQDDNNKIPPIIHVSSPSNCLPISTVQTLKRLIQTQYEYTIYIHSSMTMENFLFQREWDIFPEMKEGLLCGMGKLHAASLAAMNELLNVNVVGNNNSPEKDQVKDEIANEISVGVKRDIWRYMILWEYGGITIDIETIHAILMSSKEEGTTTSSLVNNSTTNNNEGYNTLKKLLHQWKTENNDAILYFINNVEKQRLPYVERIPLTDIMGAIPNHPLIYYSAKAALRIAIWDDEKSITDVGRTTKVPPIREGLHYTCGLGWKQVKTGDVITMENEKKHTIHLVNGDDILPSSLTSPRSTPWRSIFDAFKRSRVIKAYDQPTEENINSVMRKFADEQKYIAPKTMFSCMEYRLNMYLEKDA